MNIGIDIRLLLMFFFSPEGWVNFPLSTLEVKKSRLFEKKNEKKHMFALLGRPMRPHTWDRLMALERERERHVCNPCLILFVMMMYLSIYWLILYSLLVHSGCRLKKA